MRCERPVTTAAEAATRAVATEGGADAAVNCASGKLSLQLLPRTALATVSHAIAALISMSKTPMCFVLPSILICDCHLRFCLDHDTPTYDDVHPFDRPFGVEEDERRRRPDVCRCF